MRPAISGASSYKGYVEGAYTQGFGNIGIITAEVVWDFLYISGLAEPPIKHITILTLISMKRKSLLLALTLAGAVAAPVSAQYTDIINGITARLSTWLYKIAVNESINFLNKERQRRNLTAGEGGGSTESVSLYCQIRHIRCHTSPDIAAVTI